MTVKAIIESVRWALDEEKGYEDYETGYMDNIIRSRVYDALRWVNLYADASLLNGGDSDSSASGGSVVDMNGTVPTTDYDATSGKLKLPANFLRLIRVRDKEWSKAVMQTIREDSEEYMMQNDTNYPEAKATKERPVVAIIESSPNYLQLFPHPTAANKIEITYTVSPNTTTISSGSDGSTHIHVPDKVQTAYIYYLAYLVMIAYNETTKAANMLATAKMNAGVSATTKG